MVPSTEPNASQYSVWLRLPPSALCKLWKSREFFIETFPSPCGNPRLSRVSTGGAVCIALSVGFFTHYKPGIPIFFDDRDYDDPRRASPLWEFPSRSAPVAGDGRFAPAAFYGRLSISGNGPGFSTATTVAPLCGTSRCNSAPSDAPAESGHRIPSADTAGSAQTALDLSAPVGFFGVPGYLDFADNLKDLGWGSWERSLPDSSSLGGDSHSSPRRFSSAPMRDPPDSSQTLPKPNSHEQR